MSSVLNWTCTAAESEPVEEVVQGGRHRTALRYWILNASIQNAYGLGLV